MQFENFELLKLISNHFSIFEPHNSKLPNLDFGVFQTSTKAKKSPNGLELENMMVLWDFV